MHQHEYIIPKIGKKLDSENHFTNIPIEIINTDKLTNPWYQSIANIPKRVTLTKHRPNTCSTVSITT